MTSVLIMTRLGLIHMSAWLSLVLLTACSPLHFPAGEVFQRAPEYRPAPALLPGITPEMKTPGFWISRLEDPDRILLAPDQIRAFNTRVGEELGLTRDPACMPAEYPGRELRTDMAHWLNRFERGAGVFRADGRPAESSFFDALALTMDMGAISERVAVEWGMVTAGTDQRLLPTREGVFREPRDTDIDRLQNNGLGLGTSVAVLHWSKDRQWVWTKGPDSDGWVRADHVALCPRQTLIALDAMPFATVVRPGTGLYLDRELTRFAGVARMGTRLALTAGETGDAFCVLLPTKGPNGFLELTAGFVKKSHAVEGVLPCTRRNLVERAFELLNAPYGWGGMGGEQDCSQFVQQVFACVGLHLPRNSAAQAEAGHFQVAFRPGSREPERLADLRAHALPGASLLYMKGHIMFYLGQKDGDPFAIHSLWAYRQAMGGGGWAGKEAGQVIRVLNRVAVTGLGLGRGTPGGSLLERLESVVRITP